MSTSHLSIYLNDHLAGAMAALEILATLRKVDAGDDRWTHIDTAIREDRATLEQIMKRAGVAESMVRQAAGWVAEKVAELKLRFEDSGDRRLQRLQLIEALAIGIDGKRALWTLLRAVTIRHPTFRDIDFSDLIQRATLQREEVEGKRLIAGGAALDFFDPHD